MIVQINDDDNDGDGDSEITIGDSNRYGVGIFRFIVEIGIGFQLSGGVINIESCCVGSTEGIGERVIICICCCDGVTDVYAFCCIFCHCTGGVISIHEARAAIWRCFSRCTTHMDGDSDFIYQSPVGDSDSYCIRYFVVGVCCLCFQLSGCAINIKSCCVGPTELIGECVIVRVCRCHRVPDTSVYHCAYGAGSVSEHRGFVNYPSHIFKHAECNGAGVMNRFLAIVIWGH